MRNETEKQFRKIQRRLLLKNAIGMTYDNIRGLFAIPGVFFNMDIGGWGYSDQTVNKDSTMDERYIYIARNRIRRMLRQQLSYETVQGFATTFLGGKMGLLGTPHGNAAYVMTPAGVLWLERPPVYIINPDHIHSGYTMMFNSMQEFHKTARKLFLR